MLLLKIIEIGDGEYYDDKIKLAKGVMYSILYRLLDKGYIIDEKSIALNPWF